MNNTTTTTTTMANPDYYYFDATDQLPNTVMAFRLYVIVGSCALFVNCLIVGVFASTKHLRNRYQLLITLSIADAIDGIGLIISGVKRTQVIYNLILLTEQITIWQCAQQAYAVLAVIGAQWVAFINLSLSIERIAAVQSPIWYKLHFNPTFRLKIAIVTAIVTLISLAIGMLQSYLFFAQTQSFALCTLSLSFGDVYAAWNYSVTIFGNLIAVIVNAYAYMSIRRKFAHLAGAESNIGSGEYAHVRYVFAIACVTVCLISIPNTLLWLKDYSLLPVTEDDVGYIYVPFCCNAFINFFVYLLFNREFRIRFIRIFYHRLIRFNRVNNVNQLTATAAQTIHVQPSSKSAFQTTI